MRFLLAFAVLALATGFDTHWHAEATRAGGEANGFSADARLALQVENYLVDYFAGGVNTADNVVDAKNQQFKLRLPRIPNADPSYDYLHFDALWNAQQISDYWDRLEKNTVTALTKYAKDTSLPSLFRKITLLTILGASLHAIQDFYSHSNWVDLYYARHQPAPVWFDVDAKTRLAMDLMTGAYPDKCCPPHPGHAQINKDSSHITFPELNKAAVDAAKRASTDWIKRITAETPDVPWGDLKQFSVEHDLPGKKFLRELDATFLTSTSILAGHFEGNPQGELVFAKDDPSKEKVKAAVALDILLTDYAGNILMKGNQYHLPTPYWVGFLGYHITRELADGLMLADKPYAQPAQ